jgi:hypothetical protein
VYTLATYICSDDKLFNMLGKEEEEEEEEEKEETEEE